MTTVAALFVQKGGVYYDLPDVDPWDEERDARLYEGPHPVVAHPPCAAWCVLSTLREKVHGLPRGEDGGCFAAALAAVRKWGGVLEHPGGSYAWPSHSLPRPVRAWTRSLFTPDEWVCEVYQSAYGHAAAKRTWLFASGVSPESLTWSAPVGTSAIRTGMSARRGPADDAAKARPRGLRGRAASATPVAFRDLLLTIARSARRALSHG